MIDRGLHIFNAVLVAALWGGNLWLYLSEPPEIPMHYWFGQPTWYAQPVPENVFLVPLLLTVVLGLAYVFAWRLTDLRKRLSAPRQEKYDALSGDQQRAVVGLVQRYLYAVVAAVLILFVVKMPGQYAIAHEQADALPLYARMVSWVAVGGIILGIALLRRAMTKSIDRRYAKREAAAANSST